MSTTPALTEGIHTIEPDGVTMRYHVAGSGPVCVLHPGGPGAAWEYLRAPHLEKDLTCVYVEPVGTGGSGRLPTHPDGYSLDRYVSFVDALIDHLDVPQVHLLGHSHGGFVAQRYAITHPDRLAGLVLSGTAPAAGPELMAEAGRQMEEFLARFPDRPEAHEAMATWKALATGTDEEYTRSMRGLLPAYFADSRATEAFATLRAELRAWAVTSDEGPWQHHEALATLHTPTLVLVGQWDFICGPRWAHELHETIPGSQLVTFEHSGHFVHIEEPEEFASAVAGFVERNVAAG
ncbi:alpha/beta fold hydrolase [Pseudonocardia sp. CA-142604]|uniref:alpha/beta fold hydrolase n=1 Tax=Pseudonocardia sp. CA-142604 TaxID=3240024 RepID=UPI003D8E8C02